MKLSRHDMRELKREERKEERQKDADRQAKAKKKGRIITYAIAIVILALIGYGAYGFFTSPSPEGEIDMAWVSQQALAFPDGFTHQHADLDIIACGENQTLPEASIGGLIGSPEMHTHDRLTNQRSLASSDGNGLIHTEGNVRQNPAEHTLSRFLYYMNVPHSSTSILDYQDGDACPDGTLGKVSAALNGAPLDNWMSYLPKDGDTIVITFG